LLLKLSELEFQKNETTEKMQADLHQKEDEINEFQKEIGKLNHQVQSLEEQVNKLDVTLVEREQLITQFKDKQKHLEDQKAEVLGTVSLRYLPHPPSKKEISAKHRA